MDVGYGQLAWSLRQDDRVSVHDRTNIRDLDRPGHRRVRSMWWWATCRSSRCCSSSTPLLAVTRENGDLALMVKPQFEVGKDRLGKGGVVRDLGLRAEAVARVADAAAERGWGARAVAASPLPGPSGNVEFFLWLRHGPARIDLADIERAVQGADAAGVPDERLDP